jgi:ATP-binding protein involved in chromosome partitioning
LNTHATVPRPAPIPGVRHLIAVASGKGGVGKSTTAANLCVALAQQGAAVGLMDADIYGPNVPIMMGVNETPDMDANGGIVPLERHDVKMISLGLITEAGAPVIWRGPMLAKMVIQFLRDVAWAPLDFLVIDLPPGTGDVQLTLIQSARLDGAVIVTTPQSVALEDVRRGIQMFNTVDVPVLGIVENMSVYICGNCNTQTDIFGQGGGKEMAAEYSVPLLGEIPLDMRIRRGGDTGAPITASDPDSPISRRYVEIASSVRKAVER